MSNKTVFLLGFAAGSKGAELHPAETDRIRQKRNELYPTVFEKWKELTDRTSVVAKVEGAEIELGTSQEYWAWQLLFQGFWSRHKHEPGKKSAKIQQRPSGLFNHHRPREF